MADDQKSASTFDPGQHLSKVKGQDYLEVKWRLAWLRAEHPEAILETDLHSHENGRAIMRARVVLRDAGSATGWGSETVDTFENYIEKAETKAIGRALAALGFGTQFALDDDAGALADAPIASRGGSSGGSSGGGQLATAAQKSMIHYKARQAMLEPEQLVRFITEETGKEFNQLTRAEASRVIDALGDRSAAPQGRQSAPEVKQGSGAARGTSSAAESRQAPRGGQSSGGTKPEGEALANPGQIAALEKLGAKMDMDLERILGFVMAVTDRDILNLQELTSTEAGNVITEMQKQGG